MKVYLLLVNNEEFFFYSDESEADESRKDETSRHPGIGRWLHRWWQRLQKVFNESSAGAARWARRCWDWLHSMTRPDESMLVRLRSTRCVHLEHPALHTEAEVAAIWHAYLARRYRAHAIWLGYNTLIAPAALVFLWPLPGPNLIGYWFAYRAVHHWLILRGIRAVRKGQITTHYLASSALDEPVQRDREGKASHSAVSAGGDRLGDYLNFASGSRTDDQNTAR